TSATIPSTPATRTGSISRRRAARATRSSAAVSRRREPGASTASRRSTLSSGAAPRAPAALVGFARQTAVRDGTHDDPHLGLPVRLDRGLARTAVLLSPHHLELGADGNLRAHRGEAQRLLLVVAVACEHRATYRPAIAIDHTVVVG